MRVGRKRTQRITLADVTVHDRRSTDLTRGHVEVVPVEIDDPYEDGAKIIAMRSLRDDPLQSLFAKKVIDDAQLAGGSAYMEDWETAERGPRAIDPTKEAVDGGRLPEPFTERQRKATRRLNEANAALGNAGTALIMNVLVLRQTMKQVAENRGLSGYRWEDYFGKRLKEALNTLAEVYGFAMRSKKHTIS